MVKLNGVLRVFVYGLCLGLPGFSLLRGAILAGQAPAAANTNGRQIGTIKEISGSYIQLTTDAGQQIAVTVAIDARILQLTPGSTDLKTAQNISLTDIALGDRVLVTGKPKDDADSFLASRVILMKSGDIVQKHQMEQADWQKRGTGGIVTSIDAGTGALVVATGARKTLVSTSSRTKYLRYAGDSVKFEDAVPGTLLQIKVGDQLRVRGAKSDDGLSIQAEEVVSGSFRNLAGVIVSLDAASGTLTLKDLGTKRVITVKVTHNSSVKALPAGIAASFAARARGGASPPDASSSVRDTVADGDNAARHVPGSGTAGATGHPTYGDLSQVVSRLPIASLSELRVGDALMVVASQVDSGSSTVTALTLLSGVEPILAATPSGAPSMTLSPWTVGGGAPEGGAQ